MSVLSEKAKQLRIKILKMCFEQGGHLTSSLSCVDILTVLYYGNIINISPSNIKDVTRTRFLLSKGHAETALYAILSDLGFFPDVLISESYRKNECLLGSHPDISIPGVEISSGSLGHGLGLGAGMMLALKQDAVNSKCFVLMGDAECSEGSVWEAALFASQHRLGNLVAVIDRNGIGALQHTDDFMSLEPLDEKWKAFGWEAIYIDGHNIDDMQKTFLEIANKKSEKPLVVIAKTIKGKGISFAENDPAWHVKSINSKEQFNKAMEELSAK